MEELKIQKYMNPITFEAEMFVNSLEELSKTYNAIDANLVSSLEKVMNAIETYLDKSQNEILATPTTKLVECNVDYVQRIYHCNKCKTDLGKSSEKATLHLIDSCSPHPSMKKINELIVENNNKKRAAIDKFKEEKKLRQQKRIQVASKLTKKTIALLTCNYGQVYCEQSKICDKLKCLPVYETIERDLLSIVTPLFPEESVKIYYFGSRLAGIGTRESDLDLFLDIGGTFNTFQNRANDESLVKLRRVSNALKKSSKTFKTLVMIETARVPILRILHVSSSIECDINISNSLGTINTQFLDFIFTLQPIARAMSLFMKKWFHRTGLNEEFSTYSAILMVIFYLQNIEVLPSMKRLQQDVNTEAALTVGPWLCSYEILKMQQLGLQLEEISHENLLRFINGFFQFYVSFSYDDIICPYLGKSIKTTELDSLMPKRYANYVKDFPDGAIYTNSAIIIQDPIQLNHNVTKGIKCFHLDLFTTFMVNSLKVLQDNFLF